MDRDSFETELRHHLNQNLPDFQLDELNFLDDLVSPVRDQAQLETSSYIASVACIEMLCRKANIEIPNCNGSYYFDIDDVFSNIFIKYYDITRLNDVEGQINTDVSEILEYIKDFGIRVTSAPWSPRTRNIHSFFCKKVYRQHIISYTSLGKDEAFRMASCFPVIATLFIHTSFYRDFDEIIYLGHDIGEEYDTMEEECDMHTMLVVGNATLNHNNGKQKYFIFQNSWGVDFGYCGYVLMPFDSLFYNFWMPAVSQDLHDSLFRKISSGEELASTSQFQSDEPATKSKKTIVEAKPNDGVTEIMSRSKNIDAQSSDASLLIQQQNHKLDVHELNSRQPREDRREDTLLMLTPFRHHKRKTLKKSPGKISKYPFHKLEEKHPPAKYVSKKASNVIEKAVTNAKSAKTKKLHIQEGGLHADIDGDGVLDHVQVTSYSPILQGHDADWNWQPFTVPHSSSFHLHQR